MADDENWLTVPEVAAKFRYTTETVWKKCRMYDNGHPKGWPHKREGRTIRFSPANVTAIEQSMEPVAAKITPRRKRQPLTV